jgi:hypothetical protein
MAGDLLLGLAVEVDALEDQALPLVESRQQGPQLLAVDGRRE